MLESCPATSGTLQADVETLARVCEIMVVDLARDLHKAEWAAPERRDVDHIGWLRGLIHARARVAELLRKILADEAGRQASRKGVRHA